MHGARCLRLESRATSRGVERGHHVARVASVSSALDVYGNVTSDLSTYQQSIEKVSSDQNEIGIRDRLAAAGSNVATAHTQLGAASRSLQKFAVNEYVSSGLYSGAPLVSDVGMQPLTCEYPAGLRWGRGAAISGCGGQQSADQARSGKRGL